MYFTGNISKLGRILTFKTQVITVSKDLFFLSLGPVGQKHSLLNVDIKKQLVKKYITNPRFTTSWAALKGNKHDFGVFAQQKSLSIKTFTLFASLIVSSADMLDPDSRKSRILP